MGVGTGLLASALMGGVLAYAFLIQALVGPDHYYTSLQEDESLEWATFWAFLLAAAVYGVAGWRQWRGARVLPWFAAAVALFCVAVAMEEISWGQRALGYRPPAYFLEYNYQQELNFHNLLDTDLRKLGFQAVMAGYGIALPLLALVPPVRLLALRLAILPPPVALVPGFAVALWAYLAYPWKFTGELVELMVGLGFLFAATAWVRAFHDAERAHAMAPAALVALGSALVVSLGMVNAAVSRTQRRADPQTVATARVEVQALREDILAHAEERGEFPVRCDVSKRLYSFVEQYHAGYLMRGRFAALVQRGLPRQRAEFLIDPWNHPYWIRSKCTKSGSRKRRVFVYSFGPNRKRDSTQRELLEDDVGLYLTTDDAPAPSR
jgi:hypothetical protein